MPAPLVHITRTHHQMTPPLLMRCYTASHQYDYFPAPPPNPPSLSRLSCSLHHHCSVLPLQVLPAPKQQYFQTPSTSSNNRNEQQQHEDHQVGLEFTRPHNTPLRHASTAPTPNSHQYRPNIACTANSSHYNDNATAAKDTSADNGYTRTKNSVTPSHREGGREKEDHQYRDKTDHASKHKSEGDRMRKIDHTRQSKCAIEKAQK